MRDITNEAYRATVVLIALLDTLWTNCQALAKVNRGDRVYTNLASKFSKWHSAAERLNREAYQQVTDETYERHQATQSGKGMLGAARKMNRDARAVARFHDIPTKEMKVSQLIRRME